MSGIGDAGNPAGGEVIEAAFWAPPEAPLDMPVQVLEARRARRSAGWFWPRLPGARA